MARKPHPTSGRIRSANTGSEKPGAVSRENAEHYRWGSDCDAWYLVNDEQLSVIEEFMPPGAAEIRHHHEKAQQFFYILSGEVMLEVEGQTTLLAAGSGLRVLPGSGIRFAIRRRCRYGFSWSRTREATEIALTNDSSWALSSVEPREQQAFIWPTIFVLDIFIARDLPEFYE